MESTNEEQPWKNGAIGILIHSRWEDCYEDGEKEMYTGTLGSGATH